MATMLTLWPSFMVIHQSQHGDIHTAWRQHDETVPPKLHPFRQPPGTDLEHKTTHFTNTISETTAPTIAKLQQQHSSPLDGKNKNSKINTMIANITISNSSSVTTNMGYCNNKAQWVHLHAEAKHTSTALQQYHGWKQKHLYNKSNSACSIIVELHQ